MATLLPEGKQSFSNGAGAPLVGGKVYTYDAGTATPRATYQDSAGIVPNANPVILDARGEATIFWSGSYKVILKDALDNTIWSVDNIFDYSNQLRTQLADTTDSDLGDALVGVNSVGVATTLHKWIFGQHGKSLVADFGGVGDDSFDNSTAIETAMLWLSSNGGGTLYVPPGTFRHSLPIKHRDGVRLIGAGKYTTTFKKTGAGTINVAGSNNDLVCLGTTTGFQKMSDGAGNVNCSIWCDAPIRQVGSEIAHMGFSSTGTSVATSNTRLGLCGIGMSEASIHDCDFRYFQLAGVVLPVFFASVFYNNHAFKCGKGFAFEAGTSVNYFSNYAIYCQWHGHYFRDLSYWNITGNACDGLNNITNAPDYTDRTVNSVGYVLNACRGINFGPNGMEGCFGTQLLIDSCVDIDGPGIVSIAPQSSYTGAAQVALVYISQLAHNVTVNARFERGGTVALSGGAAGAQHHDLYVNVAGQNQSFRIGQWKTCNNKFDAPSDIYGNNVPTYLRPLKQTSQYIGEFTPVLNMVSGTGVAITYGADNKGTFTVDGGWMTVDIQLDCSNVTYAGGPVYPELQGLPFANAATKNARLIVDQSSGITWATTESYWSDVLPGLKTGTFRNRTGAALFTCPAAFATGAAIYLHITGRIYVGDVQNVV